MRITVLGKSPSWQDAGGACSGYLVQDAGTCVLLDCGSGVLGQLRCLVDYLDIDAIVVSHLHADHFLDLIPYAHALTYSPRQQAGAPARPRLCMPPGGVELLRQLAVAGGQPEIFDAAFALGEYDVGETLELGCLRARFQPVPHFIPANAIEIRSTHGAARFVYGADHGPTDVLHDFAAGADLLVLEATLAHPEAGTERGHLTAGEAAAIATDCAARRLVLTHITDELDCDAALDEARRAYAGPVEIARIGAAYDV